MKQLILQYIRKDILHVCFYFIKAIITYFFKNTPIIYPKIYLFISKGNVG